MDDKDSIEGEGRIIQFVCSTCGHVFATGRQKVSMKHDKDGFLSNMLQALSLGVLQKKAEACPVCHGTRKEIRTLDSGTWIE